MKITFKFNIPDTKIPNPNAYEYYISLKYTMYPEMAEEFNPEEY